MYTNYIHLNTNLNFHTNLLFPSGSSFLRPTSLHDVPAFSSYISKRLPNLWDEDGQCLPAQMHHVHPQHHEINDILNDHFGSNMSEQHFDWCNVVEFTESMEIFHAKHHFDGIQHLVPLIRVIVKKFHHIFLGTYQVSLSEVTTVFVKIHGFGRQIFDPAVPMNQQNPPNFTKESHVSPTHPICPPYFPQTKSPLRCAWVVYHCPWYDMRVASARCPTRCILVDSVERGCNMFRWLVLVGPGLTFSKNNHYYYLRE